MPNTRRIFITYTETGIVIEKMTPAKGKVLLYESKTSQQIPEHIGLHLNYSSISIINMFD